MEPVTMITTALAFATPYLLKTGESIAQKIGEEIWDVLKKPFINDSEKSLDLDINNDLEKISLLNYLVKKISEDENLKFEIEEAIIKAKKGLEDSNQQIINNNGTIEKQVNMRDNSGTINM